MRVVVVIKQAVGRLDRGVRDGNRREVAVDAAFRAGKLLEQLQRGARPALDAACDPRTLVKSLMIYQRQRQPSSFGVEMGIPMAATSRLAAWTRQISAMAVPRPR